MAIYDPTNPSLFLSGTIQSQGTSGIDFYPHDDNTGMFNVARTGQNITVTGIGSQSIGTSGVRSGIREYNGIDIKVGDWVASTNGQICLQIKRIISKSKTTIDFVAEDVDMLTYKYYANNLFGTFDSICFFELSDNGQPIITQTDFFISASAIDKLQSRFVAVEETERFRLHFTTPQTNLSLGDTISVSTTTGEIVKLGDTGSSDIPIGIILEMTMNKTVVYIKPFNTIIDNFANPELLTGNSGEIYYSDPSNPGKLTTTKTPGARSLFLQIKDAIPTVINTTVSNYLPDAFDSLIINNVESFIGGTDNVPSTTDDLTQLINEDSSIHHVVATKESEFSETTSEDGTLAYNKVFLLIGTPGGSGTTWQTPAIDAIFSDGTTTSTISFPENTGENIIDLGPHLGAPGYKAYDATSIASILNDAFVTEGLNLFASSYDGGDTLPYLRIEGTDSSAQISITANTTDAIGNSTFLTGTGLAANTTSSNNSFLILTRADGGDIMITRNSGDYINKNGLVSSSSGTPAMLLMLEGTADPEEPEVGVSVIDDHDMTPSATSGNGSATGCFITYTPFFDSMVEIKINGINVDLGGANNYQTKTCYFSPDGVIIRDIEDIEAGDQLYWNVSESGYELDPNDDIDFVYQTSSANIT